MSSSSSALSSLLSGSSSTSSIDLTSILQAALGASSPGIDVTSAVNAAISAARAPENAWNAQLTSLQGQASDINQIQSDVSTLDQDIQGLNSIVGPLSARTVSSSNSALVTASAAAGSTAGNHIVVVNNLATTASWVSNAFANGTTAVPADSFTITTSTGTATITTNGTQTLTDVATQINNANLGVTANVVTDANGARLALVAKSSGAAANFGVTGGASLGFAQAATGLNASLTVDGIAISSASNTVTGAVPGLTLNLQSANPGVQTTLAVQQDVSSASTAINKFVTDYNKVISDLNTEFKFNGSTQGPLATDSTIRNLQSSVLSALGYSSGGATTVSSIASLGINVNNDGTLTVDSAALQNSLQNNFSDVQTFFQGSALNGFASSLDQTLESFTNASNGAFTVDLKSINDQETDLKNSISNFETNYITPLKAQLTAEYSQAEILLQQLPTLQKQINAELGNNNNNNG
jgi:flagellar hook-associated protein 2